MVRVFFILVLGFIFGAVVIENKALYTDDIAQPVAFLPDGGQYDGKLRKGEFDGVGLIIWPYGDRYEGEFKAGLYHGKGRLETADFIYEGDFFEGIAAGNGTIRFTDGRVYQGDIESGEANGVGSMTAPAFSYEGGFKNNLFHGVGVLQESSGREYEGFFEEGVFTGKGRLTEENGAIYEGVFADGFLQGQGVFRDGIIHYQGEFIAGQFHGQGTYRDQASEYVGEFIAGQFAGTGRYLHSDGRLYQGEFENGLFSGQGVLIHGNTRYEGEFAAGEKNGAGTLNFAEPIEGFDNIIGTWRDDQLIDSELPTLEFNNEKIAETRLYDQVERLRQSLLKVVDHNPLLTDMYFVGIAGDGEQEIFRRDVTLVKNLFDETFQTQQRSHLLINGRHKNVSAPLATRESIEASLNDITAKMDANEDILLVMLSGTATKDHEFVLSQPGLALSNLTANDLGSILKGLPVKNKIVIISTCYAGGFVKPIKDDNTLIVVASAEDNTLFNCGGYRQNTVFVETFFEQYFSASPNFELAFDNTRNDIAALESQLGYPASEPLIFRPKAMITAMDRWREQIDEPVVVNESDAATDPDQIQTN